LPRAPLDVTPRGGTAATTCGRWSSRCCHQPGRPSRAGTRAATEGISTTLAADGEWPVLERAWSGNTRANLWRNRRSIVLKRDKYRCQNPTCGANTNLQVHHRRWRKDGGDDCTSNLTTLCATCHRLEQQGLLQVNW